MMKHHQHHRAVHAIVLAVLLCTAALMATTAAVLIPSAAVDRDHPLIRLFDMWDANKDGHVDRMEMAMYVLQFQENDEWESEHRMPAMGETVRWANRDSLTAESIDLAWQQMTSRLFSRGSDSGPGDLARDSFTLGELLSTMTTTTTGSALASGLSRDFQSESSSLCGEEQPQQLHIAPGQRNVHMTIMWTTKNKAYNPRGSFVQYGRDRNNLDSTVEGVAVTYDVGETGWSGWLHRVYLTDLEPNTVYYYRVGTDHPLRNSNSTGHTTAGCWSPVIPFRSLSDDPKQQRFPAKIAFYGDMGTVMPMGFAVTEALIYDHEQAGPFDMIQHIGDIAYAGTGRKWEFEFIWDAFMRQVQPLAQSVPYVVGVGNHEKYYNFTAYIHRYHTRGDLDPELGQHGGHARKPPAASRRPSLGDGSVRNFYYSFDSNGIHWIHMCTEQYAYPMIPGSPQYEWLERDLQRAVANRQNVPWIALMGHRSMYNSDSTSDFPGGAFQTNIEPLMLKYNVDFGLYGHWHMYERTLPVRNEVVVPQGVSGDRRTYVNVKAPIHITVGNAGALIKDKLVHPQPDWSVYRSLQYGYSRLTVHNTTSLHFEHIGVNRFTVLDSFWVHKF